MWIGRFWEPIEPQIILAAKADKYRFGPGAPIHGEFEFLDKIKFIIRHPCLSGRNLNPLTNDELQAFESRLVSSTNPEPYELIRMEAYVQNVRHANHDLAIVHVETAFEVFLQNLLIDYCRRHPAVVLPGNKAQTQGNQVAIEEGNVGQLLNFVNHIANQSAANIDVKNCQQYSAWNTDAYQKRNRIVHRGERGAAESDAVQAAASTQAFMVHLKGLIP
jgi:hypothetical protein